MPVSLIRLYRAKIGSVSIPWGEDTVTVTYKPLAMTPAMVDALIAKNITDRGFLEAFALGIVDGWDILGEDGQPCPITAEFLRELPGEFLKAIYDAIMDDRAAPGDDEKKGSGGGS